MKNKKVFKPMLMPNDLPTYDDIKYPMIASYKLDGIRCIFKDGEMLSRSLKQIPNKQLQQRFQNLKDYSKKNNVILDGEIYSHQLNFQQITHYVMTEDFTSERSIKKHKEIKKIPKHLVFFCFDCIDNNNKSYKNRINDITNIPINNNINRVLTYNINNKKELEQLYNKAIEDNYEGLIIRNPNSLYKFGRVTFKSEDGYKFKPYETFDAKIISCYQATKVREGAEKTTNELGRSVTSKKKGDRIPIPMCAGFVVAYKDNQLKVVLAMNEKEKKEVWKNRKTYIGKMIEYKGMLVGAKDVPRHPVFLRFRKDRD